MEIPPELLCDRAGCPRLTGPFREHVNTVCKTKSWDAVQICLYGYIVRWYLASEPETTSPAEPARKRHIRISHLALQTILCPGLKPTNDRQRHERLAPASLSPAHSPNCPPTLCRQCHGGFSLTEWTTTASGVGPNALPVSEGPTKKPIRMWVLHLGRYHVHSTN